MSLVWLPFPAEFLGDVPGGFEFDTYVDGEPPRRIGEVEFWVPAYGDFVPYADLVPQMSALSVVQTQTAGVEHVASHLPDGITLCNARGVHDAATSEMTVALILASLRGLPNFVHGQELGEWRQDHGLVSLADRKVLIVGYGSIGAALDRRLDGFECEVVRVARTARDGVHPMSELDALLPTADVVVLLVPMSEQTRHLVDAEFLAAMKDDALLVNVARGGIVDTDALLAETSSGRLRAALDVIEPEPLPSDHRLWRTPGVLITPHVAGGTTAMAPRIRRLVVDQLTRFSAGDRLQNVMD